ncbi:hypothetical protein GALMADRAFT_147126 [Galerina marginata CBS 339.88]|uniref:Uncharacterized protein n=1 Tax=Galerina marginata (strain CBS 339.88) TaxID=685588 RepID=A0A067SC88_GALM3|nr:hypothetical protein GALMADRAFT_147126 [Galerina marginata CBS 339.88]
MEGHVNFDLPVLVSDAILAAITSFWLALWPYAVDLVDRYGAVPDCSTVLAILNREYHNLALLYETYADPNVLEPANIRRMRNWLHWLNDSPLWSDDLYPLDIDHFDINLGGDVHPNAFEMDGAPNLRDMALAGPTLRSSRSKGKGRQRNVSPQPVASTSKLPPADDDDDYEDGAEDEPKPKTRRNTRTATPANAKRQVAREKALKANPGRGVLSVENTVPRISLEELDKIYHIDRMPDTRCQTCRFYNRQVPCTFRGLDQYCGPCLRSHTRCDFKFSAADTFRFENMSYDIGSRSLCRLREILRLYDEESSHRALLIAAMRNHEMNIDRFRMEGRAIIRDMIHRHPLSRVRQLVGDESTVLDRLWSEFHQSSFTYTDPTDFPVYFRSNDFFLADFARVFVNHEFDDVDAGPDYTATLDDEDEEEEEEEDPPRSVFIDDEAVESDGEESDAMVEGMVLDADDMYTGGDEDIASEEY